MGWERRERDRLPRLWKPLLLTSVIQTVVCSSLEYFKNKGILYSETKHYKRSILACIGCSEFRRVKREGGSDEIFIKDLASSTAREIGSGILPKRVFPGANLAKGSVG